MSINGEKIAELIRYEEAAKDLEEIKDLGLNQFINNGIYVALNKYPEAIKQGKLTSDFDMYFFIEILKGMFANKAFLQGILEGKDYSWFDDEEAQVERQKEIEKIAEEKKNSESFKKGIPHFDAFTKFFAKNNLGVAKQELKKAIAEDSIFIGMANNALLPVLDKANNRGQFDIWDRVINIFRFLNLEEPTRELGKTNLASLFLNHGILLASKGLIEQCIGLQKLACVICPTAEVEEIAKHNLAVCYTELGKSAHVIANYGLALGHMLEACSYKPTTSTQYNVGVAAADLANHMLKNQYFQGAIDNFFVALDAGLVLPEILNNLGVALANLNNIDEAIVYFEKALEIDPNTELARKNLEKAKQDQKAEELNLSGFLRPEFQRMEFQTLKQVA